MIEGEKGGGGGGGGRGGGGKGGVAKRGKGAGEGRVEGSPPNDVVALEAAERGPD